MIKYTIVYIAKVKKIYVKKAILAFDLRAILFNKKSID